MTNQDTMTRQAVDEIRRLQERIAELELALTGHALDEKALSRSEQKFADIFLNSLDVLLIIDVETGRILKANRALRRILGYEIEELVGQHFSMLYPPDSDTLLEGDRERPRVHGEVFQAQPIIRADDSVIPMDLTATSIPWDDSVAVLATFRDATDRENALQQLRESEQRYRTLFDQATDAIILEDANGTILDANRAACQISGYSHAELLTMNNAQWQPLRHPNLPVEADPNLQIETPFEMLAVRRDGSQIAVEITIAPLRTSGTTLFLSIIRDVTERKRAEEELRRAHGELEMRVHERTLELENLAQRLIQEIGERTRAEEQIKASLAEKGVLLQEIHHRVKNNLQIISSLLALQGRQIADEKVAEAINDSQHRIRSMALIHAQLYESEDLSRIDFAQYLVNLSTTLLRSYGDMAALVSLKMDAEPVLLGIGTAIPCGLIVNELVSNCLKHAFPEGRHGHIWVGLHRNHENEENEYVLSVRDDGVGLPETLDYRMSRSLGLRLITNLAETQLRGKLEIRTQGGTEVNLVFQDRERSKAASVADETS
jgi:PAS domain S-box-containing protein